MIAKHKDYFIEIVDDQMYTIDSTDNTVHYNKVYFNGSTNQDRFYPTSKHGIRVKLEDKELASAIICEVGGATTVHNNSFTIYENTLLICCCDKIYSLNIPDLSINWYKRFDSETCFGIYPLDNDFVIHGELQITRIDKEGNEKWSFGARDIFVTQNGKDAFAIQGDNILLRDWEGFEYMLDKNGVELHKTDNLSAKPTNIIFAKSNENLTSWEGIALIDMFKALKIKLFGHQPIAKVSDKALHHVLIREFGNHADTVRQKLNAIVSDSVRGKNRISAAILKLANRDAKIVEHYISIANTDPRDVISQAEYPRCSKLSFSEMEGQDMSGVYLEDWKEYCTWLRT